jgi:hypothetical protein
MVTGTQPTRNGVCAAIGVSEFSATFIHCHMENRFNFDCGANVGFFRRYAFSRGTEWIIAWNLLGNLDYLRILLQKLLTGRLIVVEKGVRDREATVCSATGARIRAVTHFREC